MSQNKHEDQRSNNQHGMSDRKGVLDGIRVLDFGRYIAGPYCAALLADFGADVIRIERPEGGEDRELRPLGQDGLGAMFLQVNRNKRSLAIDPSSPEGREAIKDLIATADIVVANLPPAALKSLGLDYATLTAIRPDIILVNLSAFGSEGPYADRAGFDSIGQAMSGTSWLSGDGERPIRAQVNWVDVGTATHAAFGAVLALYERAFSGRGQEVTGSLLATALATHGPCLVEEAVVGTQRQPQVNRSLFAAPSDIFRTADGWIVVQVVGNPMFDRLARLIGRSAWQTDPDLRSDPARAARQEELSAAVADWTATLSTENALDQLAKNRIPAAPVLTVSDALSHPQIRALDMVRSAGRDELNKGGAFVAAPIALSRTSAEFRRPPPTTGEHSQEILREILQRKRAIIDRLDTPSGGSDDK